MSAGAHRKMDGPMNIDLTPILQRRLPLSKLSYLEWWEQIVPLSSFMSLHVLISFFFFLSRSSPLFRQLPASWLHSTVKGRRECCYNRIQFVFHLTVFWDASLISLTSPSRAWRPTLSARVASSLPTWTHTCMPSGRHWHHHHDDHRTVFFLLMMLRMFPILHFAHLIRISLFLPT